MLRDFIKIEILENIKSAWTIGMFLVALTLIPLSIFLNDKAFSDMKSNLSVFRERYREEFQQALSLSTWNLIYRDKATR
jgi:hypothetical protein